MTVAQMIYYLEKLDPLLNVVVFMMGDGPKSDRITSVERFVDMEGPCAMIEVEG